MALFISSVFWLSIQQPRFIEARRGQRLSEYKPTEIEDNFNEDESIS